MKTNLTDHWNFVNTTLTLGLNKKIIMANLNKEFGLFNIDLGITATKKRHLQDSKEYLRDVIRSYFKKNHNEYEPMFYTQGSWKMKTVIRTKDDTCDIDDGVYFPRNPANVSACTLQSWVKKAVENVTDSKVQHRKKCITVDYQAGYNIDLPVYLFNKDVDTHPYIAVKEIGWSEDDPKEMVKTFAAAKKDNGDQLVRVVKYLKAWCDYKREKMPSGLAMTILVMNNYVANKRDDISLKYTLISIQSALMANFSCIVPATPNDDIFSDYDEAKKKNFLSNLDGIIADARKAVDEENNRKTASVLWQKHLGQRFPDGEDITETDIARSAITPIIGNSKPYAK